MFSNHYYENVIGDKIQLIQAERGNNMGWGLRLGPFYGSKTCFFLCT